MRRSSSTTSLTQQPEEDGQRREVRGQRTVEDLLPGQSLGRGRVARGRDEVLCPAQEVSGYVEDGHGGWCRCGCDRQSQLLSRMWVSTVCRIDGREREGEPGQGRAAGWNSHFTGKKEGKLKGSSSGKGSH